MTIVSAVPTTASYTTYVAPQQPVYQPYVAPMYNLPICHGPYLPYETHNGQTVPYTIYYINNVPHACYPQQPDVLYPMYAMQQPHDANNDRMLPEFVGAVGSAVNQVLEQKVESLENYLNKMEQDASAKVEAEIKKTCYNFCPSS
jgi:hypothetical protein